MEPTMNQHICLYPLIIFVEDLVIQVRNDMYPPVTLSPSDFVVKRPDTFDTTSASPDAHDTPSPVVHVIQSRPKAIPRLTNKMCLQPIEKNSSLHARRDISHISVECKNI